LSLISRGKLKLLLDSPVMGNIAGLGTMTRLVRVHKMCEKNPKKNPCTNISSKAQWGQNLCKIAFEFFIFLVKSERI
jgi:hypothetical protein